MSVFGNVSNILSSSVAVSQVGSVFLGTNSTPVSVVVSGRYAYTANETLNSMSVIDISNPAFPVQVGTTSVGSDPRNIFVSGRYAYVTNNNSSSISIVDVSNPSAPVQISTFSTTNDPRAVYVSGRYAYLAHGSSNKLAILDISNPKTPVQISSVSTGSGTAARSVYVFGRYAYLGNRNGNSISVIDVSNPYAPVQIATTSVGRSPQSIYVSGRYAYTADFNSNTISIVDVSNPYAPIQVSTASVGTNPQSIFVSGRYAYVANFGSNDISIVDVSSSTAPVLVNTLSVGSGGAESIYVSGRYAYVAVGDQVYVIDISGIEVTSIMAHSAEVGNLQSRNDIFAQGNIRIGTGLTVGYGGIMSQGALSVYASSTGVTSSIFDIASIQTPNIFKIFANGNLSIGTSTSNAKLTIQGSDLNLLEIASSTGSSLFRILTNGNVGINSSSPIDGLSVQGGMQVVGGITTTNFAVSGLANIGTLSFPIATGGSITSTNGFFTTLNASTFNATTFNVNSLVFVTSTNIFVTSTFFVSNGSVVSSLKANGLFIATSTINNDGTLFVNGSGSVSASGTLTMFGTSTFNNDIIFTQPTSSMFIGNGRSLIIRRAGSSTSSILAIKDMNNNFGSVITAGAFISRNSYFGEEFNIFRRTNCTIPTTMVRGDSGIFTAACTTGNGSFSVATSSIVPYGLNGGLRGTFTTLSLSGVVNGIERIQISNTAAQTSTGVMEYLGGNSTNAVGGGGNFLWATNTLPVFVAKVRPSQVSDTTSSVRYWTGFFAAPSTTASMFAPTSSPDGVYFTNCKTAANQASFDADVQNGAGDCNSTSWIGMIKSGTSVATTSCAAADPFPISSTTAFNYLRIEFVSSSAVRFLVDSNTADGVNTVDCGTVSVNPSSYSNLVNMTIFSSMYVLNPSITASFDIDYYRVWQDDNVGGNVAGFGPSEVNSFADNQSLVNSSNEDDLTFPDFSKVVLDDFGLMVKSSLRKLGFLIKDGAATLKELVVDRIKTNQLCVGKTCLNEQQLQEILNKTQTQAAPMN